ncbi:MAG: polysaccharide deacetylase family protein [Lachnospiraceae bacterium]|nr:polysaccharide deacetylase family protein [Lachnospiraceae bacterium]
MKKRVWTILFAGLLTGFLTCGVISAGRVRTDEAGVKSTAPEYLSAAMSGEWRTDEAHGKSTVREYLSAAMSGKRQADPAGESNVVTAAEDQAAENDAVRAGEQSEPAAEKKKIALTFDDGPNPDYTPLLLEGLRERGVQATFFLLGTAIEKSPELVEEMNRDGHEIGIHSYEHVNLSGLTEAEACEQIRKTCDLIFEITGTRPSFVRPPYGNWLSCLDNDFCMIPVFWDVDPLDWATGDASAVTRKILAAAKEYDIILMHDASASSVQAALEVIDVLQQEDFEFVTVGELIFP